ncbi:hypothetical protein GCM10027049_00670 [Mucilaginibacter puniceus]
MAATYPGFEYNANELCKFLASSDLFTILLKNGEIIHYTPLDKNAFIKWLQENKVTNIGIASLR